MCENGAIECLGNEIKDKYKLRYGSSNEWMAFSAEFTISTKLILESNNVLVPYYEFEDSRGVTFRIVRRIDVENTGNAPDITDSVLNNQGIDKWYQYSRDESYIDNEYVVIDSRIPRDGSLYNKDMKNIFPYWVRKDMDDIYMDGTIERLQLDIQEQVKLYFHKYVQLFL